MTQLELQNVLDRMITELSGVSRASQHTIDAYRRDLNEFVRFCFDHEIGSIDKITEKNIRRFIINLSEKGLTKSSISRKLSALRRLFNFAVRQDLIEKNPILKIPNPKVKRSLPETINVDSYSEIFSLVDEENDFASSIRIKAVFELLYGSALRVSELCLLNVADIDLHGRSLKVLGKGSKVRIVPVGTKSAEILKAYIDSIKPALRNNPLFADSSGNRLSRHVIYRIVNHYLKDQKIDKKSPHILRHSAATHMLDQNADLMAVKEILGHENLSTTQIYTHVSIERLKSSYKKSHPKS
ncbi:MAG: tyrosine recombinase XerC [Melioribacteraceae bacterium]